MHHAGAADDVWSKRVLREMPRQGNDDVAGRCRHSAVSHKLKGIVGVLKKPRRVSEIAFDPKDLPEEQPTDAECETCRCSGLRYQDVSGAPAVRSAQEWFQLPFRRRSRRHGGEKQSASEQTARQARSSHYLTTNPRNTRANGDTVTSPALSDAGFARPSLF